MKKYYFGILSSEKWGFFAFFLTFLYNHRNYLMSLNPEQSQKLKEKLKDGITIGNAQGISHALLRELGTISPEFQNDFKQLQDTNKKLIMDLATAISESNANVPSLARRQKTDYGTKKLVQQVYASDTLRLDDEVLDTILRANTER